MRVNLLINIPAGTKFSELSQDVLVAISSILVGVYTEDNLPGTRDYEGRAIIQAQVDLGQNMTATVNGVRGMFIGNSLDWTIVAAQRPTAKVVVGQELMTVPAGEVLGDVYGTDVFKKVPADTVNFLNDINTGTIMEPVMERPDAGATLSSNAGDLPWVWEDL